MRYISCFLFAAVCLWPVGLQAEERLQRAGAPTPAHAKKHKLDTDGIVGPKTINAMGKSTTKKVTSDMVESPSKRRPSASGK